MLEENNIKFIGPSSKLIKMMGDKIEAKKIAKKYGLPVIEGSEGGISDLESGKKLANFLPLSKSEIPPSEPSITGKPYFFAIFFASILSPIILMSFEEGPINFILFSSSMLEKLKFSDKNPYPGWTASELVISIADNIAGMFK